MLDKVTNTRTTFHCPRFRCGSRNELLLAVQLEYIKPGSLEVALGLLTEIRKMSAAIVNKINAS